MTTTREPETTTWEVTGVGYRLARTSSGDLVLQSKVRWWDDCGNGGEEWRTLETAQLAEGDGE